MRCAHKQNDVGFTLVEISIVMIIIGLLIGGTFGGMKLIENMQVNKTIQDIKSIESAAMTFKDTYGRLPGDMTNTAARLPNCTDAPCATGGNGNRIIGTQNLWLSAITNTSENFTFWHHLQASDIVSFGVKNTLDTSFGEGQPDSPINGGYRISNYNSAWFVAGSRPNQGTAVIIGSHGSDSLNGPAGPYACKCSAVRSIDAKIDDTFPYDGVIQGWFCGTAVAGAQYNFANSDGTMFYDLRGF